MNLRVFAAVFIIAAVVLVMASTGRVQAQTYTQYKIQLNSDGSASWTITQVSDLNGTVDTWMGFQEKADGLVAAAAIQTSRQMYVENSSFQISTTVTSSNAKTTEYMFIWVNFSKTQNGQLAAGDVFGVTSFFNQLYGDGALQITYPENYTLESVTPTPDVIDNSTQTLQWLGTQFFIAAQPNIVLEAQQNAYVESGPQPYMLEVAVSAVAVAAAVSGFFLAYRRRSQKSKEPATLAPLISLETEEEKIVHLLRLNKGSAYQSAITEQCKFSKAKTSQLLSALETKGIVQRYKRGRDKIVKLNE